MQTLSSPTATFSTGITPVVLLVGSIALLILGLQPLLLGQLFSARIVTLEGIGLVAMGEIVALGLGVVLTDLFLPRRRLWRVVILASLAVVALDLITCNVRGDIPITLVRAACGLVEGVLVWLTTYVIVCSHNPERLAAVFMVVQTMSQALVSTLFAALVLPLSGWQGGFVALAALSLLPCVLIRALPRQFPAMREQPIPGIRWSIAGLLPLVLAFLQMAAIGAIWAYLEPLGNSFNLSQAEIGTVVSEVLLMQVLGGIVSVFTVHRFNTVLVVALGALTLGGIGFALMQLTQIDFVLFTGLFALFGFAWLFTMPFYVSLALQVDPSGRVALLIPAMQLTGSASGPLAVSLAVDSDGVGIVPAFSAAFSVSVLTLTVLGYRWISRRTIGGEGV
ncbi:Permeases of the major facilitator superfamily [Marinobacterium lacunae]|uniref:Permeases of the major facilitator superfamily n=1 Tax=Marinobacterium lacunae TaxID=1232683 RepID=A0A081FZZ5_9GAMM|nr:MFS transporter [Marinobacterium lacunae]KEA64100.1 Permeases of the major facilitator superfamily [Marinobacterium lacunae]